MSGRLSSGSTSLRRASSHQRSTIAASRSGSCAARSLRLRQVVRDVVELPHVVVERRVGVEAVVVHVAERVERHRLPAVVVDRARAEHLEVLRRRAARARRRRRARRGSSCRRSATASTPSIASGASMPTSSSTVGRTSIACANWWRTAPVSDAAGCERGQADDAGIGDAAFVHLALPALERRVAGHRPAPRIVVVRARAADLVDARAQLAPAGARAVVQAHVVDRTASRRLRSSRRCRSRARPACCRGRRSPRGSRARGRVCASVYDRNAAKHSMKRAATAWSSGVEVVPRGHPVRPRRQLRAFGEQPALDLAREGRVAPRVPAHVEVTLVALDPFGGRVVRRVARAGREVAEERLLVVDRAQVGEELDRAVGEVGAEVVAGLRRCRARAPRGCRGRATARTGASRRRGSRTSGRSRDRAASSRATPAMFTSSSGVRCHLPTA